MAQKRISDLPQGSITSNTMVVGVNPKGEDWETQKIPVGSLLTTDAIAQSTGTSTTNVMSQKAVSDALSAKQDTLTLHDDLSRIRNSTTEDLDANGVPTEQLLGEVYQAVFDEFEQKADQSDVNDIYADMADMQSTYNTDRGIFSKRYKGGDMVFTSDDIPAGLTISVEYTARANGQISLLVYGEGTSIIKRFETGTAVSNTRYTFDEYTLPSNYSKVQFVSYGVQCDAIIKVVGTSAVELSGQILNAIGEDSQLAEVIHHTVSASEVSAMSLTWTATQYPILAKAKVIVVYLQCPSKPTRTPWVALQINGTEICRVGSANTHAGWLAVRINGVWWNSASTREQTSVGMSGTPLSLQIFPQNAANDPNPLWSVKYPITSIKINSYTTWLEENMIFRVYAK